MEDGQEHQDGGEIGAGSASMPFAEPPVEPATQVAAEDSVHEVVTSDDSDDASGLTGVLAALEMPDPAEEPIEPAPPTNDASPIAPAADDDIVALQAALESEEVAEETVAVEPVPEPAPQPELEAAATEAAPEPEAAVVDAPAPVTVAHEAPQTAGEPAFFPEDQRGVPIWPFLAYFGVWVIFAGLLVWQFMQTPAGVPLYELDLYGPSILAGLVLTAIGPLLAIGVWFMVWLTRPGSRSGLFSRSLILGAVVTLVGVALWLIALGAVDMLRLGRLI